MKRIFDILLSTLAGLFLMLPIALISLSVVLTSKGPVLYWSDRIGRNNIIFKMPKFRTMRVGTPTLASHLLPNAYEYLTPIGAYLRKSSIDELPQLWSIMVGKMSFVGPRPALFNQSDLINLRKEFGTDRLMPGLTGWAQVNGRDNISVSEKAALDAEYLIRQSFLFDLKILWMTFLKVVNSEDVSH